MNKSELLSAIADRTSLTKKQVEQSLEGLAQVLASDLTTGDSVTIKGVAVFKKSLVAERKFHNPQDANNPVTKPAHIAVKATSKVPAEEL